MDSPRSETPLRALPSVDRVLRSAGLEALLTQYARGPVVELTRQVLDEYRSGLIQGGSPPNIESIERRIVERVRHEWEAVPRRVINATGVILHTNLGRAPLSDEALSAVRNAAAYCDLEFNLQLGSRGSRQDDIRRLLVTLAGSEAAHVMVNNAAAVMVALAALARGKEVIVSRGQAVEIGGGFRIPVILRQSGARLVEVGTTNRTRLDDYEAAISARTAAILHVHTSNFRIVGFTEVVPLADLAELAHRNALLLIDDNGSGALLDTEQFGLAHEPTPPEALRAGADLVAFSGDKLLGGPQAGILLGVAGHIRKVASHPLARTVRPDKLALAALSATLLAYVRGDAVRTLPVWRMISLTAEELALRAERWRQLAAQRGISAQLLPGESTVGGGSLPGETLPTTLLALPRSIGVADLRTGQLPVIARTQGHRVLLDLRTVPEEEEPALLAAVCAAHDRVDAPKNRVIQSSEA